MKRSRPVCFGCKVPMKCIETGHITVEGVSTRAVSELAMEHVGVQAESGDVYCCPECGATVMVDFGSPFMTSIDIQHRIDAGAVTEVWQNRAERDYWENVNA